MRTQFFVFDFENDQLLKKFSNYKQAIKYANRRYNRDDVATVISLEKPTPTNKLQHLYVYDPEYPEYSLPTNSTKFWKFWEKTKATKIFDEYPVKILEMIYTRAKEIYYDTGQIFLNDNQFDYLEKRIKKDHPKSKVLKVGSKVKMSDTTKKVKLSYYMGSMNKIYDFLSWSEKGPFLITEKLDGVSQLYTNKDGELQLATRGNGTVGQNISGLIDVLDLPNIKKNVAVRGELLMSKQRFKRYKVKFANPRNMISGLVNRKSKSTELIDADFVAFELFNPRKKPSDQYKSLGAMGFRVVKHKIVKNLSNKMLESTLKQWKKSSKYQIDGLVIYSDHKSPVNTSGNPDYAVAYKKNSSEDIKEATVIDVEWNVSRMGQIKPTVILKPVQFSGSKVGRVTGHNAKNIIDNKIGKGAKINLILSGEVIPYIVEVTKPGKVNYPEQEWEWNKTNTDFVLQKNQKSQGQNINALTHSLVTLGVENIGTGLITLLVEEGLDSLAKIRRASSSKLSNIIGPNRGSNLQKDLEKALKKPDLIDLMVASNAFGIGFGKRKFKLLFEAYPKFATLNKEEILQLDEPPGFSYSSIQKLADAKPLFDKWVKSLKIDLPRPVKRKKIVGIFSNRVYAFSGVRNIDVVQALNKQGAEVVDNFTTKVTHLIVKDKTNFTAKMKLALQRGTVIQSIKEILKTLGLD